MHINMHIVYFLWLYYWNREYFTIGSIVSNPDLFFFFFFLK